MAYKKKYAAFLLTAVLGASLAGCGASGGNTREETAAQTEAAQEDAAQEDTTQEDTAQADTAQGEESTESSSQETDEAGSSEENAGGSNILIAYFTAAENSGVDAEASASYSGVDGEAKGRMEALAEIIQAETGGDLFSIQTEEVYPADGGDLIDYAAEEQDEDARPELSTHIENLDNYDTIFIGYPNWWADLPMPLYTFFEEYDFSGKTIIPFNSHNGSRFSNTISTIQELEPEATVIEDGFTINERQVPDAAGEIADWLDEIGY